jgi:hypothetical protein
VAKAIGSASDYYRLRVMTVDTTDAVDFEWREDILYRRPPATDIEDEEIYAVEAVLLDDEDVAVTLATFADPAEAHAWLDERAEELDDMTKSEFEAGYFPPSAP